MTPEFAEEALRRMLRIRYAEEAIAQDFRENKIFSFYHSSVGQEAAAVGVCMALGVEDRVYGNHRSHGHYLAKGGDLYAMLCEIYGKADGCCKGYGGSMHMLDRQVGFMGTTPILGSIAPIAVGSAFEQKQADAGNVTVAFVGDGASEEGAFYESMNLAALFKLPIIFVIEDNLYAVNSPQESRRAKWFNRQRLTHSLGLRYYEAYGESFTDVFDETSRARELGLPAVITVKCFRHMAHSGPVMDETVRVIDPMDVRTEMDPIQVALKKEFKSILDDDTMARISSEALKEVELTMADAKTAEAAK